jgi:hypothetical protein
MTIKKGFGPTTFMLPKPDTSMGAMDAWEDDAGCSSGLDITLPIIRISCLQQPDRAH